jgi:hypothetical protein
MEALPLPGKKPPTFRAIAQKNLQSIISAPFYTQSIAGKNSNEVIANQVSLFQFLFFMPISYLPGKSFAIHVDNKICQIDMTFMVRSNEVVKQIST